MMVDGRCMFAVDFALVAWIEKKNDRCVLVTLVTDACRSSKYQNKPTGTLLSMARKQLTVAIVHAWLTK